jgi:hypothetical protein
MRNKILLFLIVIAAFILLCSVSFICYKKYCNKMEAMQAYQKGLKPVSDKLNIFSPEAKLAFFDSLLQTPYDHRFEQSIHLNKAMVLVTMGQEKEAIDEINWILLSTKSGNGPVSKEARGWLALAYLRLGEKNNCFNHHSPQSCIFPIEGLGRYTDPYASQEAINVYEQIMEKDSSDLVSRWLLNIAYMTIGEYPTKVPSKWLIPGLDSDTSAYRVKPFKDVAGDLNIAGSRRMAGGAIVDDFNNDGYLDIVTSSWGLEESMHYYQNNKDGSFTDLSEKSGLSTIKGGLNIIQADYNNDGFTDILILRGAWLREFGYQPKTLLRNNGDGTFTDVTIESGILSFGPTQTAVWADFNNDGWLDLFLGYETVEDAHPHPSELYINNKDGSFTDVSNESGTAMTAFMKGVTSADYNNDGWPDIFISTLGGKKILLKNKGIKGKIPQFENATHEAGLDLITTSTFPTWFWDYDNDGWPDIFICGYEYQKSLAAYAAADALHHPLPDASNMFLFHNNHDGTFKDVSKETGLDKAVFAMGANFGDIDNDGWPDMYFGTGNPDFRSLIPNRMFKNIDGGKFVDVTSEARVGNLQKGHGVAFADINNDGNQDIFIRIGGALPGDGFYNSLYINPGQNDNKWIGILLEGTQSNRSAIGAHIAVNFTDSGSKRTVYMDVNSGGSFGANPLRKEIGIGRAKIIDELIIKWPTSGIVQVFKNILPNQFIKITEGQNKIEKMNLKVENFKEHAVAKNMISCFPAK